MPADTNAEIRALRTVLRDLVALSAIPAALADREPAAVAVGLADALIELLQLDSVFVRLCVPSATGAADVVRGTAWTTFPAWLESHLAENGRLAGIARRSAVPVELDTRVETRLAEPVERTAYYIVSEALTNTAKHAHASVVHVAVEARDGVLGLSIRDDGCGGADPARGSGLVGLTDRVDALAGTIRVASPVGAGTTLLITLPLEEG
jgi:signal transduction histidine kinase